VGALPWLLASSWGYLLYCYNKFVMILRMGSNTFTVEYYSERVQADVLSLPKTLGIRYAALTLRMRHFGPDLGSPHTTAFGGGLFELRLKGAEGIGRVFYCTQIGRRIVMLHCFVKKSDKTPLREKRIAEQRLKEVRNENT